MGINGSLIIVFFFVAFEGNDSQMLGGALTAVIGGVIGGVLVLVGVAIVYLLKMGYFGE